MVFGLRNKAAVFVAGVVIAMSLLTITLTNRFSTDIAQELGGEFARENAMRHAEKIKGTIDFDLTLTRKLASSKAILEWANHEEDPYLRERGMEELNDYLDVNKAGSCFIAFERSGHYYFNDSNGSYTGRERIKTLSRSNYDDAWFYHTLSAPEPYNLNIDHDEVLGLTKLWLNVPIVVDGKRIGVIGAGFDYTRFIQEYITQDKKGFTTMVLSEEGAIVAHREKRYVNYHLHSTKPESWITLADLIDSDTDMKVVKNALATVIQTGSASFELSIDGHHYIASAVYLPQLRWINLSMVEVDNVFSIRELGAIIAIFVLLTLISWAAAYGISHRYLIAPIQAMSKMTRRITLGDYNIGGTRCHDRSDEIGQLCRDIGEMAVQIAQSTKDAEEKYRWLADNTSDVIWVMELDGKFDYISPSIERLRGFTPEEVLKQKLSDAVSPGSLEAVREGIAEAIAEVVGGNEPTTRTLLIEQPRKDGTSVWTEATAKLVLDAQGKPFRFIGTTRDATKRLEAEEEIRKLAFYDPLTGLANRRLLIDRLEQALHAARRNRTVYGLIYLDLDNFKPLNDRFGHEVGDELLVQAGARIRDTIRSTDTAARFGGDEFVVLIGELGEQREQGLEYTQTVAHKIDEALREPFALQATHYGLSASIGVIVFGEEMATTNEAISAVDSMMYRAKKEAHERSEKG